MEERREEECSAMNMEERRGEECSAMTSLSLTCSSKGRMMSSTALTSLGCACLMPSYTSLDTRIPAPSLRKGEEEEEERREKGKR